MPDLLKPLEAHRKELEAALDEAFGKYIKKKYGYACVISGEKKSSTIFHLLGKAMYPHLRWDERNCFVVCRREHDKFHNANPFPIIDWYMDTFGEEQLQELRAAGEGRAHYYSVQELINMTNMYIKKTQELPLVKAHNGRWL